MDPERWMGICEKLAVTFTGPYVGYEMETRPLAPYIARINRQGFLTTSSQPGGTKGMRPFQRAYVAGVLPSARAARLQQRLMELPGFIVQTPYDAYNVIVAKGMTAGGVLTSWGGLMAPDIYEMQYGLTPVDFLHLSAMQIVDVSWGGEDSFWEDLIQALASIPPI